MESSAKADGSKVIDHSSVVSKQIQGRKKINENSLTLLAGPDYSAHDSLNTVIP